MAARPFVSPPGRIRYCTRPFAGAPACSTCSSSSSSAAMSKFKKVAVFCGASSGSGDAYLACAKALGEELVRRKIGLVYGGEGWGGEGGSGGEGSAGA